IGISRQSLNKGLFHIREINRDLLKIVALAVVIRIALQIMGDGSIAVDATLYSDYARNILDGDFTTGVFNDPAVVSIGNGFEYVTHQAFTYIFAVSWLILPPSLSGPTFLLVVIGCCLVLVTYRITKEFFGDNASVWVSFIAALHPLMVFHSSFGYGPEISSLVFALYGSVLFLKGIKGSKAHMLLAGIFFALVDSIWYSNFYIVCLALPLFLCLTDNRESKDFVMNLAVFVLVLIARLFYTQLDIYFALWLSAMVLVFISDRFKWSTRNQILPLVVGLFIAMSFLRWPLQSAAYASGELVGNSGSRLLDALLAPISIDLIGRFAFFIIFHLSIGLLVISIVTMKNWKKFRRMAPFILGSVITAFGTLKVFGLFEKEVLLTKYLYSDSRFFVFTVALTIIALGAYFENNHSEEEPLVIPWPNSIPSVKSSRKAWIITGIILMGFIPGYLTLPSGLALIDFEDRYGWTGLVDCVETLGDSESKFIVDRAREFTWLTGRQSVTLVLPSVSLSDFQSSSSTLELAQQFEADYFIIDQYTLSHWNALSWLHLESMSIGRTVLLDLATLQRIGNETTTENGISLTLVSSNQANSDELYFRVFQISNPTLSRTTSINLLDPGWYASEWGSLLIESGTTKLIIGSGQNFTNTRRLDGPDLNIEIDSGFILLELNNLSSIIAEISLWDENGVFIKFANYVNGEIYYCSLGDVTIGDIRIVIVGESGGVLEVKSISVWEIG
ncbi:MAG: hypothetical protein P1Q69_17755, partial [Candidatus Thorarchaeota archaeon]|nr:hypothetical protein [Candidatus Thorarchaeota archaeon]